MKNNYYDILGVTPDSEASEIKTSYRRLARKYHPDVNPDSIDRFKEINEAYSTLSDERKRMQYDMLFGFYRKQKTQEKRAQNTEPNQPKKEDTKEKKTSTEDKKQKFNYQKTEKNEKNFFDEFFNSKEEKPLKQKGSDISTEIFITIPEAKNGTTKVVNIVHTELCSRCKGRKFINGSNCPDCGGTGEISRNRKLTVKIPAGIKNETKLRLSGEGNKGLYGGENGDLYLIVKIESTSNVKFL